MKEYRFHLDKSDKNLGYAAEMLKAHDGMKCKAHVDENTSIMALLRVEFEDGVKCPVYRYELEEVNDGQ